MGAVVTQAGLHLDLRLAFAQFRVIGVDPRPVVIQEKNLCHCCAPLLLHPGQLHPAIQLGLVVETVVVAGTVFPVDNEDIALCGFQNFVFHDCYLRLFGLFSFPYLDYIIPFMRMKINCLRSQIFIRMNVYFDGLTKQFKRIII